MQVSGRVDNQQTSDERRALHARSKELVSTWPDALQVFAHLIPFN